jgi:hypothetical protein
MGEFRIYGRISGAEKKEILKEIDDADFEVEIDPGQTVETYVRSKNHSSNKIKKVVNSVIKLPNESLNQNHVVNFERFEKILEQVINEKKKVDQDGDGDMDFIDAKVAQYMKGGMSRAQAIAKAKAFAKKNSIPDNNIKKSSGEFSKTYNKSKVKNAVRENLLLESDWYEIKREGWSQSNTTLTHRGWIEHHAKGVKVPFDSKDTVTIKPGLPFAGRPAQVISLFFNKDTHEIVYGIRIFEDPGSPTGVGSTTLYKADPEELTRLHDVPDYAKNNPKFENN